MRPADHAKTIQNPLANLVSLPLQVNFMFPQKTRKDKNVERNVDFIT